MDKERELGQPDGVPCRPGATILDEQDRLWVCDKSGQKYEMILDTRAENPQIIAPPANSSSWLSGRGSSLNAAASEGRNADMRTS